MLLGLQIGVNHRWAADAARRCDSAGGTRNTTLVRSSCGPCVLVHRFLRIVLDVKGHQTAKVRVRRSDLGNKGIFSAKPYT